MDRETADEATNLLKNGILVETAKGVICMSLNDALSLDSNLSVDNLRNVAARLISQQTPIKFPQTSLNCDSDGFSSECSDISTTTSGSIVGSSYKTFPSLVNEIHQNIFKFDSQATSNNLPNICISSSVGNVNITRINELVIKTEPDMLVMTPDIINNITNMSNETGIVKATDVPKLKKGRGGWPKGRKRKPELLNLPPKAPATGYTLYLNEQRKLFKESNLAFHEITKIIGNRWSSLTLEQKEPYLNKAEEDKKRYREELKQYRQSDAYRTYLSKKRKKRLQNNVFSESDMDATDDFDEEDNEELYCRTCDQYFHNLHNKREHLQGKQHLQSVAGDMTRELSSETDALGVESTVSLSTSLDESSLDGMPNLRKENTNPGSVCDAMAKLTALVSKRDTEIRNLKNRHHESVSLQQALCSQLFQLNERHKKLQKDLLSLREKDTDTESQIYQLWQVPSMLFITSVGADRTTDVSELTE